MQIGFAQKSMASLSFRESSELNASRRCFLLSTKTAKPKFTYSNRNQKCWISMETKVKRIRLMAFNWNKWKMKIEYNGVELVCTLSLVRLAPPPFRKRKTKKISHGARKVNFVGWLKYGYVCVCVVRKYVCTNSSARMPLRETENECCMGLQPTHFYACTFSLSLNLHPCVVRSFVFANVASLARRMKGEWAQAACGKLALPFEPLGINTRESIVVVGGVAYEIA